MSDSDSEREQERQRALDEWAERREQAQGDSGYDD